jgi:hypothetical protein
MKMRINGGCSDIGGGVISYFYFNQIINFPVCDSVAAPMRSAAADS